jgi:hypothetical protein
MSALRAGTGRSDATDATIAGEQAAAAAVEKLGGTEPGLVIVYASVSHELPALLSAVREVTGAAPLAGATSNGLFDNGVLTRPGGGVAVAVLSGGGYRFGVGSVPDLSDPIAAGRDVARAARDAAGAQCSPAQCSPDQCSPDQCSPDQCSPDQCSPDQCSPDQCSPDQCPPDQCPPDQCSPDQCPPDQCSPDQDAGYAALVLLSASLSCDNQLLISGAYRVAGATVPIVGGVAGADHTMNDSFVFHNDQLLTGSAVAVWVASQRPLRVVARHGWKPMSLPMLITHVEGLTIHEIDGQPALDIYRQHVGSNATVDDLEGWQRSANVSAHALGILEPDGTQMVRAVFHDDDRCLHAFAPPPPYAAVHVMGCGQDDLLGIVGDVATGAIGGDDAAVLLAFSCVARLDILGERGTEEAALLQRAAGAVPTFGFYTNGEFARTNSASGYHNATIAAIAL